MFDINQCVGIYAADIETTGLLQQLVSQGEDAKLHNFSATSISTGKSWTFHGSTQRETIQKFLDRHIILVMHNGIGYDKKALEFFGFDVSKVLFVDSLALSWYLDRERPRHGLESYGEEFEVPKPEIKDWNDLTQEDYDHRVQEDVKIQVLTYKKLKKRFEEVYGAMSDLDFCTHRCTRYLMFKMRQLADQESNTILVDRDAAESLYSSLCAETEEKFDALVQVMPKVAIKAKRKPPAKPFKKNRELSATGEKWKQLTEEHGLPLSMTVRLLLLLDMRSLTQQAHNRLRIGYSHLVGCHLLSNLSERMMVRLEVFHKSILRTLEVNSALRLRCWQKMYQKYLSWLVLVCLNTVRALLRILRSYG